MLNELIKSTVRNHRDFREWFYFVEALDAQLKAILQKSKFGEATPEQIKAAVEELEKEYQDKPSPDKGTAFRYMQTKLGLKAGESKEGPTDPFLLNYYKKLREKQIFPEEYKTLEYFKDENKELLSEMMEKLRAFISQNKITLSFDDKPRIKFRNELMDYNDFTQFLGNIHSIEGQLADVNVDKYQNPAFLEMLHKGDLVAKGNNIWVFKGDDPIKCRVMGKGQSWCISSSTSAANYFNYRHEYGQTQYFIFDFNKAPDDPARYVNPGVAPAGNYSEWVDRRNKANKINGYKSVDEYKDYLKSQGIDTSVFKAEPITKQETDLQKLIDSNNFAGARNYPDERKTKDGIPYMFYYYLKLINRLPDEEFDSLSDIEKQEFIMGKNDITEKQTKYVQSKGIKFLKEYINSVESIWPLLKTAETAETADEMAKFIVQYKKELSDSNVGDILNVAKNKEEMAKLILQHKKELSEKLTDNNVSNLLRYAKKRNEMAKLIIQHKKELSEELTDSNVDDLLTYAINKDEIIKLIIQHKKELINAVSLLLRHAENKDEIAKLIIEKEKELSSGDVYHLLLYAKNEDEIAQLLGSENMNKFSDESVSELLYLNAIPDKIAKTLLQYKKELTDQNVKDFVLRTTNPDEMAKLIIQQKEDLSVWNVYHLLNYAENKDEIAKLIIEKKKELSSADVDSLLRYAKNGDEIAKLIIEKKKELSGDNVRDLLSYASNTAEIAELLGKENITKLSDKSVSALIRDAANRDEMAKIIQQYK